MCEAGGVGGGESEPGNVKRNLESSAFLESDCRPSIFGGQAELEMCCPCRCTGESQLPHWDPDQQPLAQAGTDFGKAL